MQRNDQLDEWDRGTFFHPSTHLAQFARGDMPNRIVTGGKGVYIEDHNGNKLLDGFAGLYCVNVGYGRSEVADAIADQARNWYYRAYVGQGTEASITLSKMIIDRAPANMSKIDMAFQDRMRTKPTSSWFGITTTCSVGPRKRKSFRAGVVIMAPGSTGSPTGLELFQ